LVSCAPLFVLGLAAGGGFDAQATVTAEGRAGEQPLQPGDPSRPFVASIVLPVLELGLRNHQAELLIGYGPRLFWEDPNPTTSSGPLILHTGRLSATARVSPTVTLAARGAFSAGEPDYSLLPQLLGTGTTSAVPAVTKILTASAGVSTTVRASPRLQVGAEARVEHTQPLGDTPPPAVIDPMAPPVPTFPRTTQALFVPSAAYQLTLRDTVTTTLTLLYGDYAADVRIATVTPRVAWKTHLTRREDLEIAVGVVYGRELGTIPAAGPTLLSPVASIKINSGPRLVAGVPTHAALSTGVDYGIDPVLNQPRPRGMIVASLAAMPSPGWIVGFEGTVATALAAPLGGNPDETTIALAVPARRRVSENFMAEVGFRLLERASNLGSSDFGFHQRQSWFYISLVAATRKSDRWTGP
jgi:hypothetical protein